MPEPGFEPEYRAPQALRISMLPHSGRTLHFGNRVIPAINYLNLSFMVNPGRNYMWK